MASQDTDRPTEMPGTTSEGSGLNPREQEAGVSVAAMNWDHFRSETTQLMDAVVERENMTEALRRVERNKGAAGIDKMPVSELRLFLKAHWSRIKGELLDGTHRPSAVREVMIPKSGGKGLRKLGIPTVVDRYFRLAEVKGVFEELDGWIRRKLRNILWRQWKRPRTRARKLMQRGLAKERAWKSATNGRGPSDTAPFSHPEPFPALPCVRVLPRAASRCNVGPFC